MRRIVSGKMEWARHRQCRLSEIVGEPMVETDKFLRNLGWPQKAMSQPLPMTAIRCWQWKPTAPVSMLISLKNSDNVSLNRTILELVGESWGKSSRTPVDTAAWGMAMAWDCGSGNSDFELLQVEMRNALGDELVDQLFPVYPDNRPIIAPPPNNLHSPLVLIYDIDWAAISTQLIEQLPLISAGMSVVSAATIGLSTVTIQKADCRYWPTIPI